MESSSNLLRLPVELLVVIFSSLDGVSLARCIRVCRLFAEIFNDSIILQYHLRLYSMNRVDGVHSTLSELERLKGLNSIRESMYIRGKPHKLVIDTKTLDINPDWHYKVIDGLMAIYDLEKIQIYAMPSPKRNFPGAHWTLSDFGFKICDIGLAVNEDVLIISGSQDPDGSDTCVRLLVLSLSTGKMHPRAAQPILCFNTEELSDKYGDIKVCGNKVVFCRFDTETTDDDTAELGVWRWDTGDLILYKYDSVKSFCFLSADYILINRTTSNDDSFATDRYIRDPDISWVRLETGIYDISSTPVGPPRCVLRFPAMRGCTSVGCVFDMKTEFTTTFSRDPSSFRQSPTDRIIVTTMENLVLEDNDGPPRMTYVIAIPASFYLSMPPTGADMEWDQWAKPEHVRMFELEDPMGFLFSTCGMKFVIPANVEGSPEIEIFDFYRPEVCLTSAASLRERGQNPRAIITSSSLTKPRNPKHQILATRRNVPVKTALPYVHFVDTIPGRRVMELHLLEDSILWGKFENPRPTQFFLRHL